MSRRVIVLLLVGLLALGSVFAAKNTVNVQVSPFSYQKVKFEMGQEFKTSYGFGAKLGYRYVLSDNSSLGAFVSYSNYKFNGFEERYLVLSMMAELGMSVKLSEKIGADFALGIGADYRIFKGYKHFYPAGSGYLGISYQVSDAIAVTAGAEYRLSDQLNKVDSFSSTDSNLIFSLGSKFSF